ncbi:MAG: penicillin-binding protein 2 [Myxococcota bacterium]
MTSGIDSTERARTPLRNLFIAVLILGSFSAVLVRLWDVQIARGAEFQEKSRENFFQIQRILHDRGEIVDREGRVLVANRPSLNVYVTPAFLPKTRAIIERLGRTVGLDKSEAQAAALSLVRSADEEGPPILLARDVEASRIDELRRRMAELELPLMAVPVIEIEGGYQVYLDPEHFPSEPRIYRRIRQVLELGDKEFDLFARRASRATGLERYREILVRSDVSPEVGERLLAEIELGDLPGVTVQAATARSYRMGLLAAHLLGYVNELTPQELEARKDTGYRLGDVIGRRGVERAYEEDLRGVDGSETVVVDSKGRPQASQLAAQLKGEFGEREPPRAGNRVVLALDLDLQRAAEAAFTRGESGAVVVLDVKTGGILAVTSTPSFDPNLVSGYFDPREKERLDSMVELRPWRFRAIQDQFAPGSTFKPVTLLAALRKKATTERESVNCPGAFTLGSTRFRCWKDSGHGPVAAVDALMRSCDVYFYTLGNRIGLDAIAAMGFDLGFGKKTGIVIDGESDGIMPTEAWYNQSVPEGYTRGASVNAAIGQGAVTVTPIQLAVAYATMANGGTVFEPQVALRIEAFDGSAVREFQPKSRRVVEFPPGELELVREGLRRVVNNPSGTAYIRRLKDMEVAGKTGTAQVAHMTKRVKSMELPKPMRDHAWFAAFAPATAPEIAVVVMVEHGGGGSAVAAPIAMLVADAWHKKQVARGRMVDGAKLPLEMLALADDEGEAE